MKVIWVSGARCLDCDSDLAVFDFKGKGGPTNHFDEWPLPCTEGLVRSELIHAPRFGGCGGRLVLLEPRRGVLNVALSG